MLFTFTLSSHYSTLLITKHSLSILWSHNTFTGDTRARSKQQTTIWSSTTRRTRRNQESKVQVPAFQSWMEQPWTGPIFTPCFIYKIKDVYFSNYCQLWCTDGSTWYSSSSEEVNLASKRATALTLKLFLGEGAHPRGEWGWDPPWGT